MSITAPEPIDPSRVPKAGRLLMSRAGLAELQAEYDRLRREYRDEVPDRLREARRFGSDSNNDEYHALREEQMVLEARLGLLEDALARAEVVDSAAAPEGVAIIGSVVTVEDLASGSQTRYTIAGAHQPPAPGLISAASPMGQALLGETAGAVLAVDLPRGRVKNVRLVAVDQAAEPKAA